VDALSRICPLKNQSIFNLPMRTKSRFLARERDGSELQGFQSPYSFLGAYGDFDRRSERCHPQAWTGRFARRIPLPKICENFMRPIPIDGHLVQSFGTTHPNFNQHPKSCSPPGGGGRVGGENLQHQLVKISAAKDR
jgi:hypothetical protein